QRQALEPGDKHVRMADAARFHPHERFTGAGLTKAISDHLHLAARGGQHGGDSLPSIHQARCYHQVGMRFVVFPLCFVINLFAASPWDLLTQGAAEENAIKRAQAIAALATVRTTPAEKLVDAALTDKDPRVRLTAVSALAERRSRATIPKLRASLDDEAGEVSFTAAKALWDLGDRSGKDLLTEVLWGERKQSAGFIKRQVRDAKSTLHNRRGLVWMGAKEGAGFLFGPLGFGLGLVEGITKDGSAPARALSATLLAQE